MLNTELNLLQHYYAMKNCSQSTFREISILESTKGRFGNKIFQLNNLLQIALRYGRDPVSNYWKELSYLEVPRLIIKKPSNGILVSCSHTHNNNLENMLINNSNIHIGDNFIHNYFFDFCNKKPSELIFVKDKYKFRIKEKKNVLGLHIRGGDIISADGNQGFELHDISYYRRAIEYAVKEYQINEIIIFTDDLKISTYGDVIKFLNKNFSKKLKINFGLSSLYPKKYGYIYDFAELSEVDYLISSSSTFSMAAGMLGKEKKIIHSKDWLDRVGKRYLLESNNCSPYKNQKEFWEKIQKKNNYYYCDAII